MRSGGERYRDEVAFHSSLIKNTSCAAAPSRPSTTRTLQQLAEQGKLKSRDIDIIMVAAGFLSYEVVEEYLAHRDGQSVSAPVSLPRRTVPEVAQEITERICGGQYHDGGSTRLVSASARDIHMQVEGACVFCPQIRGLSPAARGPDPCRTCGSRA